MAFSPGKLIIACNYSTEVRTCLITDRIKNAAVSLLQNFVYMYQGFVRLTFRIHFNSISARPLYELSIKILCSVFGVRIFYQQLLLITCQLNLVRYTVHIKL